MGLKVWSLALLVLGAIVVSAGIFGLFQARDMWSDAQAACEGSADDWCGGARTYVAALLMVTGPLATLGGIVMLLAGAALFALSRWLERAGRLGEAVATLLD